MEIGQWRCEIERGRHLLLIKGDEIVTAQTVQAPADVSPKYVDAQLVPLLARIAALESPPVVQVDEWLPTREYAFGMQARWGRYVWYAVESSVGAEPGKTGSWDWDFEVQEES